VARKEWVHGGAGGAECGGDGGVFGVFGGGGVVCWGVWGFSLSRGVCCELSVLGGGGGLEAVWNRWRCWIYKNNLG